MTNPTLVIQLPRRFLQSLTEEQKNAHRSKLKVQFSSELIQKLVQSAPLITTTARPINNKDHSENKAVHARMEVKSRLPSVRHIIRTKSIQFEEKNYSEHRRKKRHLRRWKSSSGDEIISPTDSVSNMTQMQETTSSLNDEKIA